MAPAGVRIQGFCPCAVGPVARGMSGQLITERVEALWRPSHWPIPGAAAFAEGMHKIPFADFVARVNHLGLKGETLIDAGCGVGTWAFAWATRFNRVLAFDFNSDRIATAQWLKARLSMDRVSFSEDDIRAIPASDGSADAVYNNSVALGGVPLRDIFAESFRVLKPGGAFYLGLNGLGYGYSLMQSSDTEISFLGRRTIYNTYGHTRLAGLLRKLSPGGPLNVDGLGALARQDTVDALVTIGATASEVSAARAICADLGEVFANLLRDDLVAIAEGRQRAFTYSRSARGYEPEDLRRAADEVGFERFAWAPDGRLCVGTDGSVIARPCIGLFASPARCAGHLRVFEALLWKPDSRPELAFPRGLGSAKSAAGYQGAAEVNQGSSGELRDALRVRMLERYRARDDDQALTYAAALVAKGALEGVVLRDTTVVQIDIIGLRRGNHAAALALCEAALCVLPREFPLWFRRGRLLAELGRSAWALNALKRAIRLRPDVHGPFLAAANLLHKSGRRRMALTMGERARALGASSASLFSLLAVNHFFLGQPEACLDNLAKLKGGGFPLGHLDAFERNSRNAILIRARRDRETSGKRSRHIAIMGETLVGSTLLGSLLGSLPGVVHAGEIQDLTRRYDKKTGRAAPIDFEKDSPRIYNHCRLCGPRCKVFSKGFRAHLASDPIDFYSQLAQRLGADVLVTSDKAVTNKIDLDPLFGFDLLVLYKRPETWVRSFSRQQFRKLRRGLISEDQVGTVGDWLRQWRNTYDAILALPVPSHRSIVLNWDQFVDAPHAHFNRLVSTLKLDGDASVFNDVQVGHFIGGNGQDSLIEVLNQGQVTFRTSDAPRLSTEDEAFVLGDAAAQFIAQRLEARHRETFRSTQAEQAGAANAAATSAKQAGTTHRGKRVRLYDAEAERLALKAMNAEALALFKAGQDDRALELWGRVCDRAPIGNLFRRNAFAGAIDIVAFKRGAFEQAVDTCRRALVEFPEEPALLFRHGRVLAGLGRISEALAAYRLALALKPDYPSCVDQIARLSRQLSPAGIS